MNSTGAPKTKPPQHLELLEVGVCTLLDLGLHGGEIHGLRDDGGVAGGDGVCHGPGKELLRVPLLQQAQQVLQQLLCHKRIITDLCLK